MASLALVADELLAHRLDRHVMVGEGRSDLGEDPGLVLDVEADVVCRQGVTHGQHGQVGVAALAGAEPASTRCRATATRSPSTAEAVGPPPAPRP